MTEGNERDFKNSTSCYICGEEYSSEEFVYINGKKHKIINHPVRDHCHITGKYRGYPLSFITFKAMIAILLCKKLVK